MGINVINFLLMCICFSVSVAIITVYATKKKVMSAFTTTMVIVFILLTVILSYATFSPIRKGEPIHISELAGNEERYEIIGSADSLIFDNIDSSGINNPDTLMMVLLKRVEDGLIINMIFNPVEILSHKPLIPEEELNGEMLPKNCCLLITKTYSQTRKYSFVIWKEYTEVTF